jgi:transcriptional regulator with XRE-family HTH domain
MSEFLKLVGEQIRTIRKSKGLTQEELADKSSLSFSYISDVERGTRNISLESLEKIIVSLEIMPSEIFDFKEIGESSLNDKRMIIEVIRSLLIDRRIDEVRFIHRMTKEFLETHDKSK